MGRCPHLAAQIAVAVILVVAGCGDTDSPATATSSAGGPAREAPAASAEPPAPEVTPPDPLADAPAFDVRRLLTEPDAHIGESRVCEVGFADPRIAVEPIEAVLYPEGAIARQAIRCVAPDGGGWLELVYLDDSVEPASQGQRIALEPVAPGGGRLGYPLATALRTLAESGSGANSNSTVTPGGSEGEPGFDFTRLPEGRGAGTRSCAVALVGELAIVDERAAARFGYPAGTVNRLDLRCVHEGGDSWVDLAIDGSGLAPVLGIRPGDQLALRVVRASGGFADRPVVTLPGGGAP